MDDPRIRTCLEAAAHLARGEVPVRLEVAGDDEVASLARAIDDLSRHMERLYEEALGHISAGRFSLAVDRLREAHRLAPADEAITSTVLRLERWA